MPSSCPSPNRCLFRGCPGDCQPPRQAAVAPSFDKANAVVVPFQAPGQRRSEASFKTRNAHTHRKLLIAVAALS